MPPAPGARIAAVVCAAAVIAIAAQAAGHSVPVSDTDAARTAAARAPLVSQLVAFHSGRVVQKRVRARSTRVKVDGRRCVVGRATALATLVRSRAATLALRDFGSCSRRAADAGQLFVRSIGGQRNRGRSGWVYKVGRELATAGAADPSGAFGRGRLRAGQRISWFYCRMSAGSCQRTLVLSAAPAPNDGATIARVRGYDDEGHGVPVAGATVSGGGRIAVTGESGRVRLALPRGRRLLRASKPGLVPSFSERVTLR